MSYVAKNFTDQGDGWVLDKDGVSHQGFVGAIGSLLGFCGCGRPEDALRYVRDVLAWVDEPRPEAAAWEAWYKLHRERGDVLFRGDSGVEYLTLYLLDDKKLIEHGGSVPGWLTGLGKDVLADLQTLDLSAE